MEDSEADPWATNAHRHDIPGSTFVERSSGLEEDATAETPP